MKIELLRDCPGINPLWNPAKPTGPDNQRDIALPAGTVFEVVGRDLVRTLPGGEPEVMPSNPVDRAYLWALCTPVQINHETRHERVEISQPAHAKPLDDETRAIVERELNRGRQLRETRQANPAPTPVDDGTEKKSGVAPLPARAKE
jgi:hypothetical protein